MIPRIAFVFDFDKVSFVLVNLFDHFGDHVPSPILNKARN
jgi:hypothetical protein